jgi:hypothetical protein
MASHINIQRWPRAPLYMQFELYLAEDRLNKTVYLILVRWVVIKKIC